MESKDREFFLEKLAAANAMIENGKLFFFHPQPLPPRRRIVSLPCSRLIIPLAGTMPITFAGTDGIARHDGICGEVFYAPPFGWSDPHWDRQMEFLSLVFQPDYLRLVHVIHDGGWVEWEPSEQKTWYHTSLGPDPVITLQLGVMNAYAANPSRGTTAALAQLRLLLGEAAVQLRNDPPHRLSHSHLMLLRIKDYLKENYQNPISREDVAAAFRLNPCSVSRLFMENHESFTAFLQSLRLENAVYLLKNSPLSVKEIAAQSGFNSTGYFIRIFARRYGTTPNALRSSDTAGGSMTEM